MTVEPSAASLPGWDELVIGDGIELPSHDLWLSAKVLHVLEVFSDKALSTCLLGRTGRCSVGLPHTDLTTK
jgi:hypothetical protein